VFTSVRDGDMEIYSMTATARRAPAHTTPGPDGGPFFSPTANRSVFRGRAERGPGAKNFLGLLKEGLCGHLARDLRDDSDGHDVRQVTKLGKASFAPYFHPDGKRIIFRATRRTRRDVTSIFYMINVDGYRPWSGSRRTDVRRLPDVLRATAKRLVFGSNRNGAKEGDTNIFIADWR